MARPPRWCSSSLSAQSIFHHPRMVLPFCVHRMYRACQDMHPCVCVAHNYHPAQDGVLYPLQWVGEGWRVVLHATTISSMVYTNVVDSTTIMLGMCVCTHCCTAGVWSIPCSVGWWVVPQPRCILQYMLLLLVLRPSVLIYRLVSTSV
jgi:hypothetical protein